MGLVSLEHGELAESAWKHDERMNRYKMVIHPSCKGVSEFVYGGEVYLNWLKEMILIGCDLSYSEREWWTLFCCRSRVDSGVEIVG